MLPSSFTLPPVGPANRHKPTTHPNGNSMRTLEIGDVTITSIIERDGPWRRPEEMFPAYVEGLFQHPQDFAPTTS